VQPIGGASWSEGTALEQGERYPVSEGELVKGIYRVERILAIGAMTVIAVAAVENAPEGRPRQVALKVMRHCRVTLENTVRFMDDGKAMSGLKGVHVPKVLDVGMLPSGLPFLAMDLIEGRDLESVVARDGPLNPHVAIEYLVQACEALSEADRLGIRHHDLKPADLLLTHGSDGAPVIKLLGLGIAKTVAAPRKAAIDNKDTVPESWRGWLQETTLMGSPVYKSPEQILAAETGNLDEVDGRSDVWALGAILFELVTGHAPFAAETTLESIAKIMDRPAPSLETYVSNAPPGLGALIHRCLEKDRIKRHVAVGVLAIALRDLAAKPSVSVDSAWHPATEPRTDDVAAPPSFRQPTPRPRSLLFVAWLVCAAVALAVTAGVVVQRRGARMPPPAHAASAVAAA
jgi:serine/threonine-protein kinase